MKYLKIFENFIIENRLSDYLKLKNDNDYIDVEYNDDNDGLKATHKYHHFDPDTGKYEKEVIDILFNNGYKSILMSERGFDKNVEGFLNDKPFEIKTILGDSYITIKKRIAESVEKGAEICVLYFPKNNFTMMKLRQALIEYHGETPDLIIINMDKITFSTI